MDDKINESRNAINPDPAYWHNMEIKNIKRVKSGLLMMTHTKVGMLLLESIQQNLARLGAKMKLSVISGGMCVVPITDFSISSFSMKDPVVIGNIKKASNGVGFVPFLVLDPSFRGDTYEDNDYNSSIFHELVHVDHCLMGESAVAKFPKNDPFEPVQLTIYEEARTVGLGRFRTEKISENKYREELKLPRRIEYGLNSKDDITIGDDDLVTVGPWGATRRIPLPPYAKSHHM